MKFVFMAALMLSSLTAFGDPAETRIPDRYIALLKTTDFVEVTGTNDVGGAEDFTIHNAKAIGEFVALLVSDRYLPAPKDLKPQFKSLSAYQVRVSAKGMPVLEFQVIADSVLDFPKETSYYMESDRYSENLMAPLLRLR